MSLTAPVITVVDDADAEVKSWDNGVVQANSESAILTILVWNNKGGGITVSDLKEANITSLDIDGKAVSEIVQNKWVQVHLPYYDENPNEWTPIGGTTAKMLRADGLTDPTDFTIRGNINNGDKEDTDAKQNYCTIQLKTVVPSGTTAGVRDFRIRINGYWT